MERKLYKTMVFKESGMRMDYYILTETVELEGEIAESYGVQITQAPLNTFSVCGYFSRLERDITCDYEKILQLLDILTESETDPSLLYDMVAEYI